MSHVLQEIRRLLKVVESGQLARARLQAVIIPGELSEKWKKPTGKANRKLELEFEFKPGGRRTLVHGCFRDMIRQLWRTMPTGRQLTIEQIQSRVGCARSTVGMAVQGCLRAGIIKYVRRGTYQKL